MLHFFLMFRHRLSEDFIGLAR